VQNILPGIAILPPIPSSDGKLYTWYRFFNLLTGELTSNREINVPRFYSFAGYRALTNLLNNTDFILMPAVLPELNLKKLTAGEVKKKN